MDRKNFSKTDKGLDMRQKTWDYFRAGLRIAIDDMGIDDKVFAAQIGVSAVTISHFLNGKNKTMRKDNLEATLAAVAPLQKEDLILMGKEFNENALNNPDDSHIPIIHREWTESILMEMTPAEFYSEINSYQSSLRNSLGVFMKRITDRLDLLSLERNRLYTKCNRKRAVLESMTDAVKTNDRNLTVTYCNKAYVRLIGRDMKGKKCEGFCGDVDNCYVKQVFLHGVPVRDIRMYKQHWYGISASPVLDNAGMVEEVVTVIRDITTEHEAALNHEL